MKPMTPTTLGAMMTPPAPAAPVRPPAPIKPPAKITPTHPHQNLGKYLHSSKKGR